MRSVFKATLVLWLAGFLMVVPHLAQATDWIGSDPTSGDWIWTTNWAGSMPPGPTDDVWITTSTKIGSWWPTVTTTGNACYNLEVGRWDLGHSGAGSLTILNGGDLTVGGEICMGFGGSTPGVFSTINLQGGAITKLTPGNFHAGWNGGSGQFLMSGNSLYSQTGGNGMYIGCAGLGSQGLVSMTGSAAAIIVADMRIGDDEWGYGGGCSGTISMSGNSKITRNGGDYVIFGQTAGCTGYLTMSDNASFVGVGPGNRYITSVGHDGGAGTVTMVGNTRFESAELMVGQNAGSVGNVHVTDGTMMLESSPNWFSEPWCGWEGTLEIGRWGGHGTVAFDGYSTLDVAGRTNIGNGDNQAGVRSVGSLTLSDNATMNTRVGATRNYGWIWNDGGDVYVGCAEWDNGPNPRPQTQLGGSGSLTVKDYATLNLPTGSMAVGMHSGTGTAAVSNHGVINCGSEIWLGVSPGSCGTLSINDSASVSCTRLMFGGSSSTSALIDLNGGVLHTEGLYCSAYPHSSVFNFNGGVLQATANNANFIDVTQISALDYLLNVRTGGAYIDTNGYNVEIRPGFVDAPKSLGFFNKLGQGVLTLSGASTYTGDTIVEAGGELKLAALGSLLLDVNSYTQPYSYYPPTEFYTQILGFKPGATPTVGGSLTLEGTFNLDLGGVVNPQIGDWWRLVDVPHLANVDYGQSFTVNMLFPGGTVALLPIGGSVMTYTDPSNSLTWEYTEGTGILRIIPEPGTLALLAVGVVGLLAYAWRRKQI
jgi:autotransporter-associated beta strand protein